MGQGKGREKIPGAGPWVRAAGASTAAPPRSRRESPGQNSEDEGSLTCLPGWLEVLIQGSEVLCHLIGAQLGEVDTLWRSCSEQAGGAGSDGQQPG